MMTPPASGPATDAIPPHAVHEPIAPPRSFWSNAATMIASELGVTSAPAAPWNPRATISTPIVGAAARGDGGAEDRGDGREPLMLGHQRDTLAPDVKAS